MTSNPESPRGLRRLPRATLAALVLLVAAPVGAATGLHVGSDGLLSAAQDGQPASLPLRIQNTGDTVLSQVHWQASRGQAVQCAGRTDLGRTFATGGDLSPGDGVACTVPATAPGRGVSAAVVVTAAQPDGRVQVAHGSLSQRTPRAALSQAAMVVLGAAVHNDTNANGLLDAGETISYHYTVYNAGTLALGSLALTDLTGPIACPQTTLAIAAHTVCTRSYAITPADQAAGLVVNAVDAAALDPTSAPVEGGDVLVSVNLAGNANLRVFKSPLLQNDVDGDGRASVGDLVRYTFLVKNSNAQQLVAVTLIEPDPTRIDTPITCQSTTLGGQAFAAGGTLVSTDTALCSADYTIRAGDQALGQASNLVEARAVAPIAGAISATGASTVVIPAASQIQVSKTVNTSQARPGHDVTYTITVRNVGTVDAANVQIVDPLPTGISAFTWTCAASGGATCPATSGTGAISQTVANFPAGGALVYTVTARLAANAPPTVTNLVTVTPPGDTVCMPAATPGPCRADVPLIVAEPYVPSLPVPADAHWALLLLAAALALIGRRQSAR